MTNTTEQVKETADTAAEVEAVAADNASETAFECMCAKKENTNPKPNPTQIHSRNLHPMAVCLTHNLVYPQKVAGDPCLDPGEYAKQELEHKVTGELLSFMG